MSETTTERVTRLLGIASYLSRQGRVPLSELAQEFQVSDAQLQRDLDLLWCSGLPGHYGGDLIDLHFGGGEVEIDNVEHMGIARPLRLSPDEGIALLAGVEALAEVPGVANHDVIIQLRQILTDALGEAAEYAAGVRMRLMNDGDSVRGDVVGTLREALEEQRRILLKYVSRTEKQTVREVDPLHLLTAEGQSYLRGWCYRAEAERFFRLDRIVSVEILDVETRVLAAEDHQAHLRPESGEIVTLEVEPQAQWALSEVGAENLRETQDGVAGELWVAEEKWFHGFLLSLGEQVISVRPEHHQLDVNQLARSALENYGY